jgi:hypothetical protein
VREQVASALVNKGVTLGQLKKPEDEIAVYEEVVRRFGEDDTPGVRDAVTLARRMSLLWK